MNRSIITYKTLAFIVLIVLLSACKSSKTILGTSGNVEKKAHEQLVDDILKAETDYKTISGKISLEMVSGNKNSGMKVNSQLKIVRDDVIQLSVRAPFINTEVFRLDITPDSVFIIDRMAKRYGAEDLKRLAKENNIQFNYANMQSLFTNALFIPGRESVTNSDYGNYKIELKSGAYNLTTTDKSGMMYDFVVNATDRITSTTISGNNNKYSLEWNYSDFIQDAEFIYPTLMSAKISVDKKRVGLNMSYSRLDINKDLKVDRNLPANYQRVPIVDILKNYIK